VRADSPDLEENVVCLEGTEDLLPCDSVCGDNNDSILLYDCYHLPTIVFLGCDVTFYGLGIWVRDLTRRERQDHDPKGPTWNNAAVK